MPSIQRPGGGASGRAAGAQRVLRCRRGGGAVEPVTWCLSGRTVGGRCGSARCQAQPCAAARHGGGNAGCRDPARGACGFLYSIVADVTSRFPHTSVDTNMGRRQCGAPSYACDFQKTCSPCNTRSRPSRSSSSSTRRPTSSLGDHQQDQRADAAIDQCRGDTLALDPKLCQAAGAAVGLTHRLPTAGRRRTRR